MNKRIQNASFIRFCQEFFRDQRSWSVWAGCLIVLTGIYWVFFQKEALVFFPSNKALRIDFYNDSLDGGKSTLVESLNNDSCISMSFVLRKGFIGPYTGMGMSKKANQELDISSYNRMSVQASGRGITHAFLYLITKDRHVEDTTSRVLFRHSCQNMDISPQKKTFDLVINDFKTPDWWFDKIKQAPDKFADPEWNRLVRIALVSGFNPILDQKQSLSLYSIRFERDNTWVLLAMALVQLAVTVGLMSVYFIKNKPDQPPMPVTINYKAVTIEEKHETAYRFLDYIHEHFADAELNLVQVAKHTGVPQRSISDTISQQFNCNFKTYINQIRINESQRLLKESDLNISEIAYKVGFSSPSSFNRVFKNLTGKSPSEFIQVPE